MSKKNQNKKGLGTIGRNSLLAEQHGKQFRFNPFPIERMDRLKGRTKSGSLTESIGHSSFFISADLLTKHMMVSGRKNTGKTCFKKVILEQLLHSPVAKK